MSNKRITQLTEITAVDLAQSDLLYIADISAKESKRMTANEFAKFLTASGSISADSARTADTASYINPNNVGTVRASLFASSSLSSSWASSSLSASFSATSSYALGGAVINTQTASFVEYSPTNVTASFAISCSLSNNSLNSNTASYLQYDGIPNGTVFQAVSASRALSASRADNASWSDLSGYSNICGTALRANEADIATLSNALAYNLMSFGIFTPHLQNSSKFQLNTMSLTPSFPGAKGTFIEVIGTAIIFITGSSTNHTGTLYLAVKNQDTAEETLYDNFTASVRTDATATGFISGKSGSMYLPFTLMGQSDLTGAYSVYVTCSSNIQLDENRTGKFKIESYSDLLTVES